jgi:hypothetical protein
VNGVCDLLLEAFGEERGLSSVRIYGWDIKLQISPGRGDKGRDVKQA